VSGPDDRVELDAGHFPPTREDGAAAAECEVGGSKRSISARLERLALVPVAFLTLLSVVSLLLYREGTNAMSLAYTSSVAASSVFLLLAVRRIPKARRGPWAWLLANMGLCLAGETVLAYYQVTGQDRWPTPADLFFVVAYLTTAKGVLGLDHQLNRRPAFGVVLDAAIIAIGLGMLTVVFVVLPAVSDTTQPLAARVLGTVYPVLDVLLLFLVVRMLTERRRPGAVIWWVVASILCTLTADTAQNVIELTTGGNEFAVWMNVIWASAYGCWGLAAVSAVRGRDGVAVGAPRMAAGLTTPRLVVLVLAAGLPSVVLIARTVAGDYDGAVLLGLGSIVLLGMVMARIWDLLQELRRQSAGMELMARTDPLTEIANRRSWDFELARAMSASIGARSQLLVGLLDLDHFKQFNDAHGHQAGDVLLREAAKAWKEALGPAPVIARWGGEEFAVLVHCSGVEEGRVRLDRLRRVVPNGQTVSIGIARWDGEEEPFPLLQRADQALYLAKSGGRDRSVLAVDRPVLPLEPSLRQVST
jgi:diguanylate cyclase (GGDEF)-like protein